MTKTQPRLPIEPLVRLVRAGLIRQQPLNQVESDVSATRGNEARLCGFSRTVWQRHLRVGLLPFYAADRAGTRVAGHPSLIWGDAWWDAAGLGDQIDGLCETEP